MGYQICECVKCGGELRKEGEWYTCVACTAKMRDDTLEKTYQKLETNFRQTVKEEFSDVLFGEKLRSVAMLRSNLWRELSETYIDVRAIGGYAKKIRDIFPDDAQANFYYYATDERWNDVNKLLRGLSKQEAELYTQTFVEFLVNPLADKCLLRLNDLIARTFEPKTDEYRRCHELINKAIKDSNSGLHDPSIARNVFVAYSSKDRAKAYELVEELERRGLTCFISMRNLPKGRGSVQMYQTNLETAINHCQVFVFVSTKNSRSNYCDALTKEIRYVKQRDVEKFSGNNLAYYTTHHGEIPPEKRKPRVEFLVEDYGANGSVYDDEVKDFFKGFSWCLSVGEVYEAVRAFATNRPTAQKKKAESEVKYCKACGTRNGKNIRFCGECGGQVFVETKEEYEKWKQKEQEEKDDELRKENEKMREQMENLNRKLSQLMEEKETAAANEQRKNELEEEKRQQKLEEEKRQRELERIRREEAERKAKEIRQKEEAQRRGREFIAKQEEARRQAQAQKNGEKRKATPQEFLNDQRSREERKEKLKKEQNKRIVYGVICLFFWPLAVYQFYKAYKAWKELSEL